MSTYYTQGQQPGPINFSSWSETEGHEGQQQGQQQGQQLPVTPQQFSEDPNATKLFREHFRTARDNAIPRSSAGPPDQVSTGESWYREYWYVFVIIAVVIFAAIGFYYYYKSKNTGIVSSPPVSSSSALPQVSSELPNQMFSNFNNRFGSSGLSSANGILNDLEFL